MLSQKQIGEIKEHLEKAQNPLFFFDNDADGLCSFLLLARFSGKGKGVAIKSFPELDISYARKLHELSPDYIFILDKPLVSKNFLEEAKSLNLPVVWIDHHDTEVGENLNIGNVYYYNPQKEEKKEFMPTTYITWKATEKKEDMWIAFCGCIGDNYLPDFKKEFQEHYPELAEPEIKTAFQALYETSIGKITRVINFALKDRTGNVMKMIRLLLKTKFPNEILEDTPSNSLLYRYKQLNKKYQKLIEKAKNFAKKRLLYFQYGGDLSMSADISNELCYNFPEKVIVVAYIRGTKANISIRGKGVKEITLKAIEGLEGATGGGHDDATGCKVELVDLPKFKERIEKLVGS
ncbi:DHH family phosphoesterase [Candidatus Pacearchaeota archaeon]|nr:DHH family phosphoesterase [Candidatus Pacearchaeota archaeon]